MFWYVLIVNFPFFQLWKNCRYLNNALSVLAQCLEELQSWRRICASLFHFKVLLLLPLQLLLIPVAHEPRWNTRNRMKLAMVYQLSFKCPVSAPHHSLAGLDSISFLYFCIFSDLTKNNNQDHSMPPSNCRIRESVAFRMQCGKCDSKFDSTKSQVKQKGLWIELIFSESEVHDFCVSRSASSNSCNGDSRVTFQQH